MRLAATPTRVPLPVVGAACCAGSLLLAVLDPAAATAGWLAAFAFWSGAPLGALVLLMMMRLVPGAWAEELAAPAERAALTMPLLVLAVVPLLVGHRALYPWAVAAPEGGFRGVYLDSWFFVARTALFLAVATLLAVLPILRPRWRTPAAAAGLILFVPLDAVASVDWLMSLEPEFHSSGFGLYILSGQVTTALCILVVARLRGPASSERVGVLGGLLSTALLLWAYLAFMQYVILWSGDRPFGAAWYQRRAVGSWPLAEQAMVALELAPAFLLIFAPVRRGRRWLLALAASALAGRVIESLWLVLPAIEPGSPIAAAAAVFALLGLGALGIAGFIAAPELAARLRAARPRPPREATP